MTTSSNTTTTTETDPRPILDRAIATAGSVIASVQPDQLAAPTPCEDMDVHAMFTHLVGVLDRIAALGNGQDPFAVVETGASPATVGKQRGAESAERIADAWERRCRAGRTDGTAMDPRHRSRRALVVLLRAGPCTPGISPLPRGNSPCGTTPLSLRRLLALARCFRPRIVSPCTPRSQRRWGLTMSACRSPRPSPVPDGASAIDQLVAWNGRNPAAD